MGGCKSQLDFVRAIYFDRCDDMQGAIFSNVDVRDYQAVCTASSVSYPKEFELKTVRVKNQGSTGACVAHAISSIVEYYNFKQNNDKTEMSTGYIYGNRQDSAYKDRGMIVRDALEAVRKYGDVPKSNFPYNVEVPLAINMFENVKDDLYEIGYPHRISQYCRVNNTNAIKSALMAGNPVLIAMDWYKDMKVSNGILITSFEGYDGGHCMFIYGWNEKGWKVQNSWGLFWGNNGKVVVPYDMKIRECWTITDNVIEGMKIKKPFSSHTGKAVAKLINGICNKIKRKM